MPSDIKCPVCGSEQIHAEKKGFSTGKAVAGTILTGDLLIGALAGSHGKDKIELTCLKCGHKFYPGDPLSVNHTVPAADTDKFLAEKKDLPKTAYYKCSCGKVSMLETDSAKCPKCGRRLTEADIITEDEAKVSAPKSGCLGHIMIPLLIGTFLLIHSCVNQVNRRPATELSFSGFSIGGSFVECYNHAETTESIKRLANHYYDRYEIQDSLFDYAYFYTTVPYYDHPGREIYLGPVCVESFKGTVSSLEYSVENKDYCKSIISMYQGKYGEVKPQKGLSRKKDQRKYLSTIYRWDFENGGIIITENTHHIIPFSDQLTYDGIQVRYYDLTSSTESYDYLQQKWDIEDKQQRALEDRERERIILKEDF